MIRTWLVGVRGTPSSWNRFAYVEGDPVNKVDRCGLDEEGLDDDKIIECGSFGEIPESVCRFFVDSLNYSNSERSTFGRLSPGRRAELNERYVKLESEFSDIAKDLAKWFKSEVVGKDCLYDLGAFEIKPDQLAERLSGIQLHNGLESTTPLADLLRPGSAEHAIASQRGFVVGNSFTNGSNTSAMASLNSSDVWLSPFRLKSGDWSHNAATVVHETLHTFNKDDSQLQKGLFGFGPEIGAASINITNRLWTDCFQGYSGPK